MSNKANKKPEGENRQRPNGQGKRRRRDYGGLHPAEYFPSAVPERLHGWTGNIFWRFMYGIGVSLVLSPLRLLEWIFTAGKIARTKVEHDPVFIIGYYRSGTTYLITMFSKDPNRGYVSNVEGYLPTIFLGFPRLAHWIVDMSIPEARPMDNVVMTPEEPTEEEYSIGAYEKYSIYNGFVWPKNFKLYSRYNSFKGLIRISGDGRSVSPGFTRKLTASYKGRQIVYKNPTATFRIEHLLEMYPNAKFVHIYRNPYKIYSSNVRYHDDVISIYTVQNWEPEEINQCILDNYAEMYECFNEQKAKIPEGNLVEVKYEDFVKTPIGTYGADLQGSAAHRLRGSQTVYAGLRRQQAGYKPNKHILGRKIIAPVNIHWGHIVDQLGYQREDEASAPEESQVITPEMES
jgi:hypothetical protein